MQSCEYWQSKIEEYLDNALADSENQDFLTHISSCSECQEALKLAQAVRHALAELPDIDVPKDFNEHLHEKIDAITTKRQRLIIYSRRGAALAACVVLAVAVNAGGLYDFFIDEKSNIVQEEQIGIDLSTFEPVYTTEPTASPTPSPASDNSTGEKVRTTTPTKDTKRKKQTPTPGPQETAEPVIEPETDVAAAAPAAVDAPAPTPSATPSSQESAPMPASAMYMLDLSDDPVMDSTIESASGGGGSARSAVAKTYAVGSISVAADSLEQVKAIALSFAVPSDGIYRMSSQSYEAFKAELEQNGISFSDNATVGEEVCFTIESL